MVESWEESHPEWSMKVQESVHGCCVRLVGVCSFAWPVGTCSPSGFFRTRKHNRGIVQTSPPHAPKRHDTNGVQRHNESQLDHGVNHASDCLALQAEFSRSGFMLSSCQVVGVQSDSCASGIAVILYHNGILIRAPSSFTHRIRLKDVFRSAVDCQHFSYSFLLVQFAMSHSHKSILAEQGGF